MIYKKEFRQNSLIRTFHVHTLDYLKKYHMKHGKRKLP